MIVNQSGQYPGKFICKCGKGTTQVIYDGLKTSPCLHCGRIYIGNYNTSTGIMEAIEYDQVPLDKNSIKFQDITPKKTFSTTPPIKSKTENLFDIEKVNSLTFSDIKKNCVVRSIKKNTCNINRNMSCNKSNCIVLYFSNIIKMSVDEDSTEYFQFKNYSKKCKVKGTNNRCTINSNKPCLAKNCVMFNFLKVIENNVK